MQLITAFRRVIFMHQPRNQLSPTCLVQNKKQWNNKNNSILCLAEIKPEKFFLSFNRGFTLLPKLSSLKNLCVIWKQSNIKFNLTRGFLDTWKSFLTKKGGVGGIFNIPFHAYFKHNQNSSEIRGWAEYLNGYFRSTCKWHMSTWVDIHHF